MNSSNTPPIEGQRAEGVTKPDIEAVDRLSDLPDDLILEIFSSLPTETTIATSVLSRRWTGLWKEMKSLKFDNKFHRHNFSENVISALLSYQHSTIQNLTIGVKEKCDTRDLTTWFAIAFVKHVSNLELRLDDISQNIMFPDGALTGNNTLKILKLIGPMYIHLPLPTVTLNRLRELHLHYVRFHNGNSVPHLLKGCYALEVLVIVIRASSGIVNITVNSPSLLKLTLAINNSMDENFVIQTPLLEYLDIQNFEGVDSFIMDNAPKLSVAKINRHNNVMVDNILDAIPSVEHLTLSAPLRYPTGKTFYALKTLDVDTTHKEWCNLVIYMLIHSLNIEMLKIIGGYYGYWGANLDPKQYMQSSLVSRLHTLVWKVYVWDQSDNREVATFILRNASQLSKATFSVFKPSNTVELKGRNEMLNNLSNVVRASPSCDLVFKDFDCVQLIGCTEDGTLVIDFSP